MKIFFEILIKKASITMLVFIVFVLLAFAWLLFSSPMSEDKLITIEKNSIGRNVVNKLEEQNIIYSKTLFLVYLKISGKSKDIIPGEFLIPANTGFIGVANFITNPKNIYSYKITLVDGQTVKQFLAIINNDSNLSGKIYKVKEGTMMPDTYYFIKGDTKESIISRSTDAMQQYLDDLWETRDKSLPYKTKHEALVMASMIEKETGIASERDLIAGLFVNRLKIGMKMQSDPTVAYGLGKPSADKLTKSDLITVTPYNTYTMYGLPVGPIANPSRETLRATFFPSKTKYLYFVADGKGGHVFTTNLVDHNKEVVKWRAIEKEIRRKEKASTVNK